MNDEIRDARAGEIETARSLFLEYAASLGFSLCFQGFDREVAELPGAYAPPRGALLLAFVDGVPAGCGALRPLPGDDAELKRIYVRPAFRGTGLGRRITEALVSRAEASGYGRLLLDTVAGKMDAAIALYRSLGFVEVPPYTANPVPGALCLGRALSGRGSSPAPA